MVCAFICTISMNVSEENVIVHHFAMMQQSMFMISWPFCWRIVIAWEQFQLLKGDFNGVTWIYDVLPVRTL